MLLPKKARRPPLAVKDFGCVYLVGLLCCMEQEAWGKISPVAWAKVLHSRNDQMCVLKDGQRTRATISKHNSVLFIRKADTFFHEMDVTLRQDLLNHILRKRPFHPFRQLPRTTMCTLGNFYASYACIAAAVSSC